MVMNTQTILNCPKNFNLLDGQNLLSGKYFYISHNKKNLTITFYDTFDWRIYNAGLVLYSSGKRFYLRLINTEIIIADCGFQKRPVFIRDFSENDLKKQLTSILGVRALMKKGMMRMNDSEGILLNKDNKTVCKTLSRKIIPLTNSNNAIQSHMILLFPLRGYSKDCRQIINKLNPYLLKDPAQDPFFITLKANGIKAGDYSGKFGIQLKRQTPAQEAIKAIFKTLINVIRQNEDGIINDLDTEFLHDFRVAVRRIRAALGQLQIVFSPDLVKKFKKDFSYLGRQSNQLRDLDVYLLNETMYKSMLPLRMRESISILFNQLNLERKSAHQQFADLINNVRYNNIIKSWQNFLDSDTKNQTNNPIEARLPIIKIVKPVIREQLNTVLNLGSAINDNTEDEKIHELRIECKKLRYLLEFFISLFPQNKIETFINHLKILQDNLGKFNDFSIQQEFLQNYIIKLPVLNDKNKQVIAAVGALIGILNDRQVKTRQEFAIRYAQFASSENFALAMKLFND